MNLKTKRTVCLLVGIMSILTIVGTISYAYFTATAQMAPVEASITTGTARVRFADNDNGVMAALNFGESISKKFTIENTGTVDANVRMYWENLINTYIEGSLTYILSYAESEEGLYTEVIGKTNVPRSQYASKKTLASSLTIPVGQTYYYELKVTLNYLEDVNQDDDLNAVFNSNFTLEDIHYQTAVEKIIASSHGVRTSFDEPATADEGIFEMEDDYGTSYYYRGAVTNNYVKFAGFYWRIIRVNGDGSLRIIYDGDQAYANGTNSSARFIGTSAYNTNSNDNKYVGWMYGPVGTVASVSKEEAQSNVEDSTIKKVVDAWYKTNIVDKGYSNVIADVLFCNDRTTPGKTVTRWTDDTGLGYGKNATAFGAFERYRIGNNSGTVSVKTDIQPTFMCAQKNDAFTVSDTVKGNGALTYPVGLITADEIVAAGSGKIATSNGNYYLYRPGNWWWALSPADMGVTGSSIVFYAGASGDLNVTYVHSTAGAIAPVINLNAEYVSTLIGDGTMENPYREKNA